MIFISYNHNDKDVVETIALKLAKIFGEENIFYDAWSIQPGDEIIDKMNFGLSKMNFFLFFVSRNSLNSNFVKLEWQNALYKAAQGKCKFVPIKLDDCIMPPILLQNLYIDIYNYGLDVGLSQITDFILGKNVFRPNGEFNNIICELNEINVSKFEFTIKAIHFQEPISRYLLLFLNDINETEIHITSDNMFGSCPCENIILNNGLKYNGYSVSVNRPTTPGFPVRGTIEAKNGAVLNLCGAMKAISENNFKGIPLRKYHS